MTRARRKFMGGVRPGDINSVVYFCDVAPRAHWGKCDDVRRKPEWGVLFQKIGEANAPRSAGCSKTNSAHAVCAARSSAAVRRTISLAC
eukprot:3336603-Pleurochrysis_carterae.AAC.1